MLVAAFHRQIYHRVFNQFPLMMFYGGAGSGKTSAAELLIHLHYFQSTPLIHQAGASTPFVIGKAMSGSASIPCVLDEYKPRNMGQSRHMALQKAFHGVYNGATYQKGGGDGRIDSTWMDTTEWGYSAPVLYIGEALETETAIQDRTLAVPFIKDQLKGTVRRYNKVRANRHVLSGIGKAIVQASFAMLDQNGTTRFQSLVEAVREEVSKRTGRPMYDRPVYNLAVAISGLDYLKQVLGMTFSTRFDTRLDEIRESMFNMTENASFKVMAEASKALNSLALMSMTEDPMSELGLRHGVDYLYGSDSVELKLRNCFVKYVAWCKRKGQPPLFQSEEQWFASMASYGPVINKSCIDSLLKDSPSTKVFRFSLVRLAEEGVDDFKRP